jgi:hypothetical protein
MDTGTSGGSGYWTYPGFRMIRIAAISLGRFFSKLREMNRNIQRT